MLILVIGCDEDGGIGKDGKMPWPHSKEDMKRFKQLTSNTAILMGRKTWDSLPIKPLPNRFNMVLSKNKEFADNASGCYVINDINKVKELSSNSDIYLIGGAELVEALKDSIGMIFLSRFNGSFDCDTFIDLDWIDENFSHMPSDRKQYHDDHTFEIIVRKGI